MSSPDVDNEQELRALAAPLLLTLRRQRAAESLQERWLRALMQRLQGSEALRVQALRFIDVFPALRDDAELDRHLREYFPDQQLLPEVARWGLRVGLGGRHARAVGVRAAVRMLARRFMGGEDAAQALTTITGLRSNGLAFTLDCLGEASISEADADAYQARYLRLIAALAPAVGEWPADPVLDPVPRLNLSLKVSALYSQIDPVDTAGSIDAVCRRLRPIFATARSVGAAVCLDMEQYELKGVVFGVLRQLLMTAEFRDWPDAAVVVQAYLKDAAADLEELLEWVRERGTPLSVRLVRGAYWDYETVIAQQRGWPLPVWGTKRETDLNYDRCADWLLVHRDWLKPLIATHNLRSIVATMARAGAHGLRSSELEFQVLHGMGEELAAAIRTAGYRVRVYVPFGPLIPGMAYLVRRLLENSASQQLAGLRLDLDRPLEELLQLPPPAGPAVSDAPAFRNEPQRCFHVVAQRDDFSAALARVEARLGRRYPLSINDVAVTTAQELVSCNPADPQQVVGVVAAAGEPEIDRAILGAAAALDGWAGRTMRQRAHLLRSWATVLRRRRDEFAAWEVFEAGKGWRDADADVAEAIDFLDFYAGEAERLEHGFGMTLRGEENHNHYGPRGVAVVIPPWNFPLAIAVGMTAAALVTGNTVVLKPSSRTPVVAARFVDLLRQHGLPPGVLQFVPGSGAVVGDYLVGHPGIHLIAFTGSIEVGTRIARIAARRAPGQSHLKTVLAEMGGKNAIIVDADADLDQAVVGVLHSAFGFQGQKCSACSRVVLVGSVRQPFLQRLIAAVHSLRIGAPRQPGNFMGPVIDGVAAARIRDSVERARESGRVLCEADVTELGEGYVAPVVIDGLARDHELARRELFGPVLVVFAARDFEQALVIANDADFALTGGVYSRSPANLMRARASFRVGNLYLNRGITGARVGRQPFGGFRLSGSGDKAGGSDYLKRFALVKTVTENSLRRGFAPQGSPCDHP